MSINVHFFKKNVKNAHKHRHESQPKTSVLSEETYISGFFRKNPSAILITYHEKTMIFLNFFTNYLTWI